MRLNSEAKRIIRVMKFEEGKTYGQIVEALNTAGYRNIKGNPITRTGICQWAITRGIRTNRKTKKKYAGSSAPAPVIEKVSKVKSSTTISHIMGATDITRDQKLRMLEVLM
jgi:hypothetical protein